ALSTACSIRPQPQPEPRHCESMHKSRELPQLILARHARMAGSEQSLRRTLHNGSIVRVRRGAYTNAAAYAALSVDERYRLLVQATAETLQPSVPFARDSAAVAWGLPGLGPWSQKVHLLDARASGGRSHSDIQRHCLG